MQHHPPANPLESNLPADNPNQAIDEPLHMMVKSPIGLTMSKMSSLQLLHEAAITEASFRDVFVNNEEMRAVMELYHEAVLRFAAKKNQLHATFVNSHSFPSIMSSFVHHGGFPYKHVYPGDPDAWTWRIELEE